MTGLHCVHLFSTTHHSPLTHIGGRQPLPVGIQCDLPFVLDLGPGPHIQSGQLLLCGLPRHQWPPGLVRLQDGDVQGPWMAGTDVSRCQSPGCCNKEALPPRHILWGGFHAPDGLGLGILYLHGRRWWAAARHFFFYLGHLITISLD